MKESTKESSFLTQGIILAVSSIITRFIGFLYRVPLTNLIGDEGMSIYGSGYYIYMFFLILSSAGLPVAISKMVSARIAEKRYRNAHQVFKVSLMLGGGVGLIATAIMAIFPNQIAQMINSPKSSLSILTLAPTIFIVAIMSSFRGYFQGMKNSVPTAISQLIEQIVNAFFSVYLAYVLIDEIEKASAGATAATGLGAVAGLLVLIAIYLLVKKPINKRVNFDKDTNFFESNKEILIELLKTSIPVIIGTAVFSMTNIIDTKMVKGILLDTGFSSSETEVLFGQLSNKYNSLVTLPVSISTAIAVAAIPSISSSEKIGDMKNVRNKINTAMRITMLISIPAAVGIGVLSQPILDLLFRSANDGASLLRVGAVSIIFLALTQITTGMLQGIGKVKIPAIAALFGAIIKIPCNYIFVSIPELNVLGAIIGTTFCYAVASAIDMFFLFKYTKTKLDVSSVFIKPLISSGLMGIACYTFYHVTYLILKSNTISTVVSIIAGVITYFIFMVLLKALKKEDVMLIPFGKKLVKVLEKVNAF